MWKKILVLLVEISFFLGVMLGYALWIGPEKIINELVRILSEAL